MSTQSHEEKAAYLMASFNGNIQSCIIVCNEMIALNRAAEDYKKVKEILIQKRDGKQ